MSGTARSAKESPTEETLWPIHSNRNADVLVVAVPVGDGSTLLLMSVVGARSAGSLPGRPRRSCTPRHAGGRACGAEAIPRRLGREQRRMASRRRRLVRRPIATRSRSWQALLSLSCALRHASTAPRAGRPRRAGTPARRSCSISSITGRQPPHRDPAPQRSATSAQSRAPCLMADLTLRSVTARHRQTYIVASFLAHPDRSAEKRRGRVARYIRAGASHQVRPG